MKREKKSEFLGKNFELQPEIQTLYLAEVLGTLDRLLSLWDDLTLG